MSDPNDNRSPACSPKGLSLAADNISKAGSPSLRNLVEAGQANDPSALSPSHEGEPDPDQTKSGGSQYPVTWLPAMMVPPESPGQYMVDSSSDKLPQDIMSSTGTYVQLPQSYSVNSNGKIYGLVVGPNTVLPLESLSLVNFSGFGKLSPNTTLGSTSERAELNENLQNMVKVDGCDVSQHEGITGGDLHHYSSIASDTTSITREHPFCHYCQKYYKTANDLQNHILIEHSDQAGLSFMGDTSSMHPSLRTCPGCGHQLRRVGTFDSDYPMGVPEDEHNFNLTHGSTNILMVCDNCCKEFTLGLATDTSHVTNMEPPKRHACDHCEKSYKHNRDLRKHLRTHHGMEHGSHSSLHNSNFNSGTSSAQISGYQEGPPPTSKMTCQQCKKMFRGPFELRRHIHTVHENKRPYKCPECSKLFRDAYELKRHSASHQRVHFHSVSGANIPTETSQVDMLRIQSRDLGQSDVTTNQSISQMMSGGILRDVYTLPPNQSFTHGHNPMDYYCSSCDKNFRGANEFKRHYSVVHEKKYRYKCIHCGKLWRDQYDLKRHCRRSHFVDRDIDRAFIRQCLLDNNPESTTNVHTPISISNYDMSQHVGLTLNHEAVAAIFGSAEQDMQSSANQLEPTFTLVDHNNLAINRSSPTGSIFQNLPSIQPPTMLYHSSNDPNHMVENIMQPPDDNEINNEETKNAVSWSNFESDIQAQK